MDTSTLMCNLVDYRAAATNLCEQLRVNQQNLRNCEARKKTLEVDLFRSRQHFAAREQELIKEIASYKHRLTLAQTTVQNLIAAMQDKMTEETLSAKGEVPEKKVQIRDLRKQPHVCLQRADKQAAEKIMIKLEKQTHQ